jgi:hypothetical protein
MLPIGCGVAGPPKKIAAPVIAANKPKLIRKLLFTASNENKLSHRWRIRRAGKPSDRLSDREGSGK